VELPNGVNAGRRAVLLMGEMPGPKVVPLAAARAGGAPAPRTDEELMLLVRAGSREAMAAIASRYIGPLTGFCVKLTGDPGAGEDIVQETFVRVWVRRTEWRPRGTVAALLFTTARNLCRNRARDVRRRGRWLVPETSHLGVERLSITSVEIDPILVRERRRDALEALGELPDAMREAVLLRFDGEMGYDAIAAIVGANESTVRSRVHNGLLKLKALVVKKEKGR
jgi:RNA polymerase sigma-70 factor (ECF subfamily)